MALKIRILERFGSQTSFAEVVGVRDELVSRVIRGRRAISDKEKVKWAEALGVDSTFLSKQQPQ